MIVLDLRQDCRLADVVHGANRGISRRGGVNSIELHGRRSAATKVARRSY